MKCQNESAYSTDLYSSYKTYVKSVKNKYKMKTFSFLFILLRKNLFIELLINAKVIY